MTAALAGKALLFLGCTALGVLRGQGLRQRAACLQVFRRVLAALARELILLHAERNALWTS